MWVPLGAGPGKARVSLSYPSLGEEWNILPATLEVPVEGVRAQGWLWHYGPWVLGVGLAAAISWLVIRARSRRRRAADGGRS